MACVNSDSQRSIVGMFHKHYPAGCPPTEVVPASGRYHRLVDVPITEDAVKSKYEEGKGMTCVDRGISFYEGIKGVKRLMNAYQDYASKKIALLALQPEWGVMYRGKNKGGFRHVNVWLYRDAPRSKIVSRFELVEGEDER